MSIRKVFLGLTIFFLSAALNAQAISLADLQMYSIGYVNKGINHPIFITAGNLGGRFVPANWIRFKGDVSFLSLDSLYFLHPAPEINTPASLKFNGVSVESPEILGNPINIAAFTGTFDDPASGSLLRSLLKYDLPAPEFYGMPAGKLFTTDTWINGTGIAVTGVPANKDMVLGFYGYWNTLTGDDTSFTADFRFGKAGELISFNAFGGCSLQVTQKDFSWRGGLSSVFTSPAGNMIYTEAGLRITEFTNTHIDRNLYFLFEPRIVWDNADLAFSFFSTPSGTESTFFGANVLAGFGNLRKSGMRGGISVLGCMDPEKPTTLTPLAFSVSPFYSIMLSDLLFNITIMIKPLHLSEPENMGELQLSLKAVL
jgi:hypothetical protein